LEEAATKAFGSNDEFGGLKLYRRSQQHKGKVLLKSHAERQLFLLDFEVNNNFLHISISIASLSISDN